MKLADLPDLMTIYSNFAFNAMMSSRHELSTHEKFAVLFYHIGRPCQ